MIQQATYVWEAKVMPMGGMAPIYAYALVGEGRSEAAIGTPQQTLINLGRMGARQVLRQQLTAIEDAAAPEDPELERLRDMARRGEIVLGPGTIPDGFWEMPAPEDPEDSVRQALIEGRE